LATLSTLWNSLQVILGLGFVIFFHELGHFLLAKWNDVKVEKFSIGFGPTLLGFRKGETEYVIAAIPLGGFVKMLGESPEEEASKSTDPRAYPNKSVGARMAIISAGVIMNVILAFACFAYAYGQGIPDKPPIIGGVVAGTPAYLAGLRTGDEIVSIDGKQDVSFTTMQMKVRLSGEGQVLQFGIKRPGVDAPITIGIEPKRGPGADWPQIGVLPKFSLNAVILEPPAGMISPPTIPETFKKVDTMSYDTLVAAGPVGETPTPLQQVQDYEQLLIQHADKELVHVFESKDEKEQPTSKTFELTLPPAHFVDFGFRFEIEPINGIQKDSIAEKAGFRIGDKIVKINGDADFDPMRVPTLCQQNAGKPMTFEVERTTEGQTKTVTIDVTPDASPAWLELGFSQQAPLEIPGLGLCFPVRTRIAGIRPDSPADRAGLKVGDLITGVGFPSRATPDAKDDAKAKDAHADGKAAESATEDMINFEETPDSWVRLFFVLQYRPIGPVSFVVNKGSSPVKVTPEIDKDWYFPDRGLRFLELIHKLPPLGIVASMQRGVDDTVENILGIYSTFRSLAQRRIGTKSMAGPVKIVQFAYAQASYGLTELIRFLGIISINLAVINFLPIPPLDGGQMLLLIAEKVRGKPLPESAVVPVIYLGILFILCLFVLVTYQDVFSIFKEWGGGRP
jgi:regulator of sigma E protease